MAIFLRESDVGNLANMEMALRAVEGGFRLQGSQKAENAPRRRCRLEHGMLHVMSASVPPLGLAGLKSYTTVAGASRFHVLLYSSAEGTLLAVMEADLLGQLRTGAASGIATRYMARKDAARVGIIGTGWQARSQLAAACAVRPVTSILAFGRDPSRRESFCREMSDSLGIAVQAAASAEEAVSDRDIVITATSSSEPVFRGEWLAKGTHINAVGSNSLTRQEIDVETVRRTACVIVDSVEQSMMESGDLTMACEAGALFWEDVRELGLVVVGDYPGREDAAEITLFKSNGIALEDVALAGEIYQAAVKAGVGKPLPF